MINPLTSAPAAANAALHIVLLGVAAAVIAYDRDSRSSRTLAAALGLWGSQHVAQIWLRALEVWPVERFWRELGWLPGWLSSIAVAEWLIVVLRTSVRDDTRVRWAIATLRVNQLLALASFLLSVAGPAAWLDQYSDGGAAGTGFRVFKSLDLGGYLTLAAPVFLMLLARVDFGERQRVLAMVAATPFFLGAGILPSPLTNVLCTLVGVLVFLVGAMGYQVLQGRRGEFMSRFLSPQVRSRIADEGMERALAQQHVEISVVCCDLRGFTAYAEAKPAPHVADVLRRYYDVAGEVAARYGATIKDFAGDGVLVLVGAPQPAADHARIAVDLARELVARVGALLRRHCEPEPSLGVGAGVATGPVMVGVIDSTYRHEYAAVGPAVNLAARLCGAAAAGQVRVSEQAAQRAAVEGLVEQPRLALKGVADAVPNYAIGPVPLAT